MDKIPSFQKNHNLLLPGFYFSGMQKGIATFDLRFKRPNAGGYIPPAALHTIEHLLATTLRNGPDGPQIIYFGPMGCRTGFYLLTTEMGFAAVLRALKDAVDRALELDKVPGAKKVECGNYRSHDLSGAKKELAAYRVLLDAVSEEEIEYGEEKMRRTGL